MSHGHIIAIDEDGLNSLPVDNEVAALELGTKILRLCRRFGNPLNRFNEEPSDKPRKRLADFSLEPIGPHAGAIHWVGYPGSDRDEIFFWGSGLKPLQQVDDKTLELIKRRIEREIAARTSH